MTIKLLVGLQNPGTQYEATRHNAGAWWLQYAVDQCHGEFRDIKKFHGSVAEITIADHVCKALLPHTFMNNSGRAVQAICQFYRITPQEVLVIHDELDLPVGRVQLKLGGGHAGHNGLRDIIQLLGGPQFLRLRVGIGHPGHKQDVVSYVLGKPSLDDRHTIDQAIQENYAHLPALFNKTLADAMNIMNAPAG